MQCRGTERGARRALGNTHKGMTHGRLAPGVLWDPDGRSLHRWQKATRPSGPLRRRVGHRRLD
eukprot:9610616-Lingulodinium_polyedra.AAC.1